MADLSKIKLNGTEYNLKDAAVPAWAKVSTKPTYTAAEVGALPDNTSYVSSFNGNSGAVTYTAPVASVNGNTGTVIVNKIKTSKGQNNSEYMLCGVPQGDSSINPVYLYNPGMFSISKYTANFARLTLGNSNTPGVLRLYNNNGSGGYSDLKTDANATQSHTITFPNATGTVALTTDIPSVPSWAMQSSKPSYTFSELTSHPTTINDYGITDAYTKTEVDGLVSGVLHYKGTKATVSALPSSGNVTGDVWHVTANGSEWAWDGSTWQELGTAVDLSGYLQTGDIASWAKAANKPTYTASEVGALPSSTTFVSSFNGQSGSITYTAPVTSVNGRTGAVTVTEYDDTALVARVSALEQIPWVTYYTGSNEPSNNQGQNGDLYFQTSSD